MIKSAPLPYKTILVIDSAEREETNIALSINGECSSLTAKVRAQELPSLIEGLVSDHHLLPANIDALALVKRPGSVTAIRIGTAIVNTLAWLERKHIIEISAKNIDEALNKLNAGQYEKVVKISQPLS